MAKYKFQFKTGHVYDGPTELVVKDFIAEVEGEVNPSLALAIKAQGGQLVPEPPVKARRKAKPVKWPNENKEGEK